MFIRLSLAQRAFALSVAVRFTRVLSYSIPQLSMASEVHDSDSDGGMADLSPRRSHMDSPPRQGQSDQPGPADSEDDSGVYEIEAILDAKRGATGSVSS